MTIAVTRRTFTLTAIAGLTMGSTHWLPDDLLVLAKEVMPDQWCMIHCLGYDDRRIEGMAEMAHLQWIDDEYVVTTPLTFFAPHACTVTGFEIELLLKGEVTDRPFLFAGDMLDLRISLNISQAA